MSLPWQPGSVLLKYDYIIGYPEPKTPVRRNDLGDISHTRRLMTDFVLNLVTTTTGGRPW